MIPDPDFSTPVLFRGSNENLNPLTPLCNVEWQAKAISYLQFYHFYVQLDAYTFFLKKTVILLEPQFS